MSARSSQNSLRAAFSWRLNSRSCFSRHRIRFDLGSLQNECYVKCGGWAPLVGTRSVFVFTLLCWCTVGSTFYRPILHRMPRSISLPFAAFHQSRRCQYCPEFARRHGLHGSHDSSAGTCDSLSRTLSAKGFHITTCQFNWWIWSNLSLSFSRSLERRVTVTVEEVVPQGLVLAAQEG